VKRRLFTDVRIAPTGALLRKESQAASEYYANILPEPGANRKRWEYSQGNGWILRVGDYNNALYYLVPFEDGIGINLTVRDAERADFLNSAEFSILHPQLESATKYSRGYALQFEIESSEKCQSVTRFLTRLITMRSA